MNPLLIKAAPWLIAAVVLIGSHAVAYRAGFQTGIDKQQVVIDKMVADASRQEVEAAKKYAENLEIIRQQSAEVNRLRGEIERKTLKMIAQVQENKAQNKLEIENAITQDKAAADCIDGMGVNGLHQYRRALGYSN